MNSNHLINLPATTYNFLQQLANDNERTINEEIISLINEHHQTNDLITGLDTVPSILVNELDSSTNKFLDN